MVFRQDASVPVSSLRALVIRHCATLVERAGTLRGVISFAGTGDPATQITEARALAHQIAGAGGSIGFDRLSDLAAVLERKLVEVEEGAQPASKVQLAEIEALCAGLEREAARTKPEHSRLYNTDLSAFVRTGT